MKINPLIVLLLLSTGIKGQPLTGIERISGIHGAIAELGTMEGYICLGGNMSWETHKVEAGLDFTVPITTGYTNPNVLLEPYVGYNLGDGIYPFIGWRGGGVHIREGKLLLAGSWQYRTVRFSLGWNIGDSITKFHMSRDVIFYSLCTVSGFADGILEEFRDHWPRVLQKFPNIDKHFWGPMSWQNKYKNWVSEQVPTLSDGYHLLHAVERGSLILAGVLTFNDFKSKHVAKRVLKKLALGYLSNRIGHRAAELMCQ